MNQDEIIEMARQAGFSLEWQGYGYSCLSEDIINFAKLVAAKEREACAKVCEEVRDFTAANEIRARGEA